MTTYKPSNQAWALTFTLTGIFTVVLCHHIGVPTDIGAGIIGAGLAAYTQVSKQVPTGDSNGDVTPKP